MRGGGGGKRRRNEGDWKSYESAKEETYEDRKEKEAWQSRNGVWIELRSEKRAERKSPNLTLGRLRQRGWNIFGKKER